MRCVKSDENDCFLGVFSVFSVFLVMFSVTINQMTVTTSGTHLK